MLPPPEVSGHQGQDSISEKNLDQGEGKRETTKDILGWIVGRENFTLQLMQDKCEKSILLKKLEIMKQRTLQRSHEVSVNIQHVYFGIPGGKDLLYPIHRSMRKTKAFIPTTLNLRTALSDWHTLIQKLGDKPTPVQLLVINLPN